MLIECKPANSDLNINHASQLFRYFSVTAARVAVLTNGVIYKFFSDVGPEDDAGGIETTEDELTGYNIIRTIAAQKVDIERIAIRDSKSYCAILLDDNNRKTIARLWFNSPKTRHLGTFKGKEEIRVSVDGPTDIYKHSDAILARLAELTEGD